MKVGGILFDLEGVLYQDGAPINGAKEALETISAARIPVRFLTNTTTRARLQIAQRLHKMGFQISPDQVFSPTLAACRYLRSKNFKRIYLATEPELEEDFDDFIVVKETPEAVIMGDLHTKFNWPNLNKIFDMIMGGAKLIALHRNRYCRRDGHIALDLGPFVKAVEYAASIEAVVMGKPERAFFELALDELGIPADQCVMIGDDPYSDIAGAKQAGLMAIQVKTGKYRPLPVGEAPAPDMVLNSVTDLPLWLGL